MEGDQENFLHVKCWNFLSGSFNNRKYGGGILNFYTIEIFGFVLFLKLGGFFDCDWTCVRSRM